MLSGAGLARPRNPRRCRSSAAPGDDVPPGNVAPQPADLDPKTGPPWVHLLTVRAHCAPEVHGALPARGERAAGLQAAPSGSTRAPRVARRHAPIPTFSLKRKKHNRAVAPSNMGRWTFRPHSRGSSSSLSGVGLARFRSLRRRRASAAPDDDVPSCSVALTLQFWPTYSTPRGPPAHCVRAMGPCSARCTARTRRVRRRPPGCPVRVDPGAPRRPSARADSHLLLKTQKA